MSIEAFLTITNPNEAEVVTLTDPVTKNYSNHCCHAQAAAKMRTKLTGSVVNGSSYFIFLEVL